MSIRVEDLPKKDGWYWIKSKYSYDKRPIACYYQYNNLEPEASYFLPGKVGDSSSNGIYMDDIVKIGPEIQEPNL